MSRQLATQLTEDTMPIPSWCRPAIETDAVRSGMRTDLSVVVGLTPLCGLLVSHTLSDDWSDAHVS